MKNRLFTVLLSIFLLAFPCVASAEVAANSSIEEYNQLIEGYIADGMTIEEIAAATYANNPSGLSEYSDNYLRLLLLVVEHELQQRGFANGDVVVPMGEYTVGEDIPAGKYTVTTGESYCNLQVYSNGKRIYAYDSFSSETIGKLTLTDGQIVKVQYDSVIFSPYKGLGF